MSRQNRRTVLKQGGAIIAGVTAVTGTAAADSDPAVSSMSDRVYFTPENELNGPTTQNAPDTTNLSKINTWGVHKSTVECDNCGRNILSANYQISVYRTHERDPDGDYHYVYWMWSQSDTDTDDGNDSSLTRMESRVDIKDDSEDVSNFKPKTTETMNQRSKDVGISFGFGGFSFGISSTIYVNDGEYGPWQNHVDLGYAGEYGVSLDANNTTGRQTLIGTLKSRKSGDWDNSDNYYKQWFYAACEEC